MDERNVIPLVSRASYDAVALAASAGGLAALTTIVTGLDDSFPTPILVVQHLDRRHRSLMAEMLSRRTSLDVTEALDGDKIEPGSAYVAPPDHHLLVKPTERSP